MFGQFFPCPPPNHQVSIRKINLCSLNPTFTAKQKENYDMIILLSQEKKLFKTQKLILLLNYSNSLYFFNIPIEPHENIRSQTILPLLPHEPISLHLSFHSTAFYFVIYPCKFQPFYFSDAIQKNEIDRDKGTLLASNML